MKILFIDKVNIYFCKNIAMLLNLQNDSNQNEVGILMNNK